MSRIFEFIDPEGSSEPQNHNEVQASYLTLCQYSSKYSLLFDQYSYAHYKLPSLGCRSARLKRADI